MVKCSSDTDKAHISESSATVIVVLLSLQYHCPPNLELHQHLSRAWAGPFLVYIYIYIFFFWAGEKGAGRLKQVNFLNKKLKSNKTKQFFGGWGGGGGG